MKDVTIFGVCSKSKHEALKATGTIDHILERGADYSNEVRKCVTNFTNYIFSCNSYCYQIFRIHVHSYNYTAIQYSFDPYFIGSHTCSLYIETK